ncbi:hypothetical protein KEM52_005614, partial [Ascosphaera acerosa]
MALYEGSIADKERLCFALRAASTPHDDDDDDVVDDSGGVAARPADHRGTVLGLVYMTGQEYDDLLRSSPQAALRYRQAGNGDGGDVEITSGSELRQRCAESAAAVPAFLVASVAAKDAWLATGFPSRSSIGDSDGDEASRSRALSPGTSLMPRFDGFDTTATATATDTATETGTRAGEAIPADSRASSPTVSALTPTSEDGVDADDDEAWETLFADEAGPATPLAQPSHTRRDEKGKARERSGGPVNVLQRAALAANTVPTISAVMAAHMLAPTGTIGTGSMGMPDGSSVTAPASAQAADVPPPTTHHTRAQAATIGPRTLTATTAAGSLRIASSALALRPRTAAGVGTLIVRFQEQIEKLGAEQEKLRAQVSQLSSQALTAQTGLARDQTSTQHAAEPAAAPRSPAMVATAETESEQASAAPVSPPLLPPDTAAFPPPPPELLPLPLSSFLRSVG